MPIIKDQSYRPLLPFRSGHLNTVYPYFFRKNPIIKYDRQRIDTADNDFIDVDRIRNKNSRLAILCHGLEGSSESQYILGTSALLSEQGWDIAALNHRGCSGEPNRQIIMYHSGFTEDLNLVINTLESDYEEIVLVGFSLGGNMVLKYLGDGLYPVQDKIKAAVAISVPVDLAASSVKISRWYNYLYEKRFIISLREKILFKAKQFPNRIRPSDLKKVKSLLDFDNYFTGPLHGFKDASDYYNKSHSKQFLHAINIPTLIINALDDPFLPPECYPFKEAEINALLYLLAPKFGGHVGFTTQGDESYWVERKLHDFISDPTHFNSN